MRFADDHAHDPSVTRDVTFGVFVGAEHWHVVASAPRVEQPASVTEHRGEPLQSAMSVAAFALGIGLTTSMFSIGYSILLRGMPYERALLQPLPPRPYTSLVVAPRPRVEALPVPKVPVLPVERRPLSHYAELVGGVR